MTRLLLPYPLKINNASQKERFINFDMSTEPILNWKCAKSNDKCTAKVNLNE